MRQKLLMIVTALVVISTLSGCEPYYYQDETYDLSSVRKMGAGEWYHFNLKGSDSNGDRWSGSISKSGLSPHWLDNVWVTPVETELYLEHYLTGGVISRSSTVYMDRWGREVKMEMDNGVVCYPQSTSSIPQYAYTGDYGDLGTMSCSDGTDLTGVWDLYDDTAVNADFVTLNTVWYGDSVESVSRNTQTLTHDGEIISINISFYLYEYDVTIWLSS